MQKFFNKQEETLPYFLEKLAFIKLEPEHILVIGNSAVKDKMLAALTIQYPQAKCDFLSQGIRDYPVKLNHYGLIFSHWLNPLNLLSDDLTNDTLSVYELLFYLFHHFLTPGGLLLFSYVGPETDQAQPPMQALGDILLKLEYQDPVLDRDRLPYEEGALELAYGHAWKKLNHNLYASKLGAEGTVFMPISQIQHLETTD